MLIKFGDYNSNYKYIYLVILFNFLCYFINDGYLAQFLFPYQTENNLNKTISDNGSLSQFLFSNQTEDNYNYNEIIKSNGTNEANETKPGDLYMHPYFVDNINFFGIIIISFILYKYNKKKSGINNENDENKLVNASEIRLIHNDIKHNLNQNISFLNFVFILSYWVAIDHITRIIESLMIFDYWMFELLFICIITSKLLKTQIYRHQKLGIIINSVSCFILGIIKFIITYKFYNNDAENIYYFCVKYLRFIPISIIIYLFIVNSTSYIFTELKFYMDLKFISQTKLLILYGLIGFILNSIACSIETSFKCNGGNKDFFCKINVYPNETEVYDSYVENIVIFFYDFSKLPQKVFIIEIFLFLFGIIAYYGSIYFEILVIKFLTPMHFMFSSLIYLFFMEFINLIQINTTENDSNDKSYQDTKDYQNYISVLNIIAYIISLIGFMIYLEIIELNFCKLNYNLRKYINARSLKDSEIIMNDDSLSRSSSMIINDSVEMDFKEEKELLLSE